MHTHTHTCMPYVLEKNNCMHVFEPASLKLLHSPWPTIKVRLDPLFVWDKSTILAKG